MSFLDHNNEYLVEVNNRSPDGPRDPLRYWPSESSAVINGKVVGKCHRAAYWRIRGEAYTNYTDIDTIRKQRIGKAFEQDELDVFLKNPQFDEVVNNYKIKYNLTKDILLSAEFDAIVKRREVYRIVEFKSGGGRYFRDDVFGSRYNEGMPKDYYLMQVMLYLDIARKTPELADKDITEAEIYVLDREKCKTVSHLIRLSDGYPVINGIKNLAINVEDIYDRYKQLHYCVVREDLPFGDFRSYIPIEEVKTMKFENSALGKWKKRTWLEQGYGCEFPCSGYCAYTNKCQHENGFRKSCEELI